MSALRTSVRSERGAWTYEILSSRSICFRKTVHPPLSHEIIEAYGPAWLFGVIRLRAGKVSFTVGQRSVAASGKQWAVFYPPFTIAKAKLESVELEAKGFWCTESLSGDLPTVPVLLPWPRKTSFPMSSAEIARHLRRTARDHLAIPSGTVPSSISRKAKENIDRSFSSPSTLAKLAFRLRTSSSQLSRAFRADYGLSPLAYRNHLRVVSATFKLLQGSSPILSISGDVGFGDLGRFYKAVKKTTLLTPGKFKARG